MPALIIVYVLMFLVVLVSLGLVKYENKEKNTVLDEMGLLTCLYMSLFWPVFVGALICLFIDKIFR